MTPTPEQLRRSGAVDFEMVPPQLVEKKILVPVGSLVAKTSEKGWGREDALTWKGLAVEGLAVEVDSLWRLTEAHPLVLSSAGGWYVLADNRFGIGYPIGSEAKMKVGEKVRVEWGEPATYSMLKHDFLVAENRLSELERVGQEARFILICPNAGVTREWLHEICAGNNQTVEALVTALKAGAGGSLS